MKPTESDILARLLPATFKNLYGVDPPIAWYGLDKAALTGTIKAVIYAIMDDPGLKLESLETITCDHPSCDVVFAIGPGTNQPRLNREVAYCTPKCQKAHAYMKRKDAAKND